MCVVCQNIENTAFVMLCLYIVTFYRKIGAVTRYDRIPSMWLYAETVESLSGYNL